MSVNRIISFIEIDLSTREDIGITTAIITLFIEIDLWIESKIVKIIN
jgi:hypothetical protein